MLIEAYPCDVVLSDDGLQHYALERDIEFAVIDGVRRLGNGFCLPAGPLREPGRRLSEVDFVVVNGAGERPEFPMRLRLLDACNLLDPRLRRPLEAFRGQPVHAVAGIGNPERFFSSLREAGLDVLAHPFRDHHPFRKDDLAFADDLPVLMTEKDAVKCHAFASPHHWYVPLEAELPDRLGRELLERLRTVRRPVANARES
jgi:tetraacyldisaccharide 4'-kinase